MSDTTRGVFLGVALSTLALWLAPYPHRPGAGDVVLHLRWEVPTIAAVVLTLACTVLWLLDHRIEVRVTTRTAEQIEQDEGEEVS